MSISKALLEKYELGQCNDQELAAVRQWLDSDDWEGLGEDGLHEDVQVKNEIWEELSQNIINEPQQGRHMQSLRWKKWSVAVAACMLMVFGSIYYMFKNDIADRSIFEATNLNQGLMRFEQSSFDVALSENSYTSIDLASGNISLTGDIMIKPKKDFVLLDERTKSPLNFKRGEIYFISEDLNQDRLIILKKTEIIFLPPILQRQLKKQFHIS